MYRYVHICFSKHVRVCFCILIYPYLLVFLFTMAFCGFDSMWLSLRKQAHVEVILNPLILLRRLDYTYKRIQTRLNHDFISISLIGAIMVRAVVVVATISCNRHHLHVNGII